MAAAHLAHNRKLPFLLIPVNFSISAVAASGKLNRSHNCIKSPWYQYPSTSFTVSILLLLFYNSVVFLFK
jgi:hypothetical protein